ncbi:hypothetical protein BD626DRAFT_570510 [Schizophyllum amplum]|uniref:Uncharacterized protein n=1 Tax=Schizophyllum amplum TaxID=97359 RepID=A0A550CAH9_9AGAR|nr:hypothetical protein BD626DRAFT_570510 [Auriculariopsis ampla]
MSPPPRAATVPIINPQPMVPPPAVGSSSRMGSPVASTFSLPERPSSAASTSSGASAGALSTASGPIPRANFFPKSGTARPRSRSFSGFNNTSAEVELSKDNAPPSKATPPAKLKGRTLSTQHSPSPLSLPQNNIVTALRSASAKPPTSPLAQHSSDTANILNLVAAGQLDAEVVHA